MTAALDFGISAKVAAARRCLIRTIEECIDEIGMETACGASGARRQDLRDALNNRDGRRLEVEWCMAIAMISPEHLRAKVAGCLVEALGYGVAPIVPLTTEQRLARLEYRVASRFGAAVAELVEENQR